MLDPEIIDYETLSLNELHEIAEPLFANYFNKNIQLNPHERKARREEYNVIANVINKKTGWKVLIIITPSTRIEIKPEHLSEVKIPKQVTPGQPRQINSTSSDAPKTGKVAEIIALYKSGKTRKEIVEAGFNKNTVNRQIGEYEKSRK